MKLYKDNIDDVVKFFTKYRNILDVIMCIWYIIINMCFIYNLDSVFHVYTPSFYHWKLDMYYLWIFTTLLVLIKLLISRETNNLYVFMYMFFIFWINFSCLMFVFEIQFDVIKIFHLIWYCIKLILYGKK